MAELSGAGARLFLAGSRPVPFRGEPLERLPDGSWRISDPGRRLWAGDVTVEADTGGEWRWVEPVRVEAAGGRVLVDGAPARVRATGSFLPLLHLADADGWQLRTEPRLVATSTLGSRFRAATPVPADAEIVLTGCQLAEPLRGQRVLVELYSGRARLDCVGGGRADSGRVTVTVDPAVLEFA